MLNKLQKTAFAGGNLLYHARCNCCLKLGHLDNLGITIAYYGCVGNKRVVTGIEYDFDQQSFVK